MSTLISILCVRCNRTKKNIDLFKMSERYHIATENHNQTHRLYDSDLNVFLSLHFAIIFSQIPTYFADALFYRK